jgi:hypothetical protein
VFCPNCGTQNPEVAATCSKCNFALKGVVAPKFKGTMLMMNQPQIPGVTPGVPATPAVPPVPVPAAPAASAPVQRTSVPGAVPGAPLSAVPSKLKGTMVGVAPMALQGQSGQAPVSVPSAGATRAAPPAPAPVGHLDSGPGYMPPAAQGVNPLGGTVAADAGGFAHAFGAGGPPPGYPQQGFPGPQPPQQAYTPYGAPPPGTPPPGQQPVPMPYDPSGYGGQPQNPYGGQQPQNPYGGQQPQNPYGGQQPQNPYGGQQPQNPYGGQQPQYGQGAYGAPPQAYGQQPGGAIVPYAGGGPTRRNALMTWLMPFAVIFGGFIVSMVLAMLLGSPSLGGGLFGLFAMGGGVWALVLAVMMAGELMAVTQNEAFAWWPILIPFYSIYWAWIAVPQEVTRAKQMLGVQQPTRSILLYIFLWHYALASDLNDMVR